MKRTAEKKRKPTRKGQARRRKIASARLTLKKAIARASSPDEASKFAKDGLRPLTDAQRDADLYCAFFEYWKKHGHKAESWSGILSDCASRLCERLLAALDTRDPNPFREIAELMEAEKLLRPPEDTLRFLIVCTGQFLRERGLTIPIAELAVWVGFARNRDIAQLRRIAKELNFPLAPSAVGRPKKGDK